MLVSRAHTFRKTEGMDIGLQFGLAPVGRAVAVVLAPGAQVAERSKTGVGVLGRGSLDLMDMADRLWGACDRAAVLERIALIGFNSDYTKNPKR